MQQIYFFIVKQKQCHHIFSLIQYGTIFCFSFNLMFDFPYSNYKIQFFNKLFIMNIKILVETLIQIPDLEMSSELIQQIKSSKKIMISDLKKFFLLIKVLLSNSQKKIVINAYQLLQLILSILLINQIQMGWNVISKTMINLLGCDDYDKRKKAKGLIINIMKLTKNTNVILNSVYYEGLQNEQTLVIIKSIKLMKKIIESDIKLVQNKLNLNIMKLIIQKIIQYSKSNITGIKNELFYMQIERFQELVSKLSVYYQQQLQEIWEKEKQNLLKVESAKVQIKFQHLIIINNKVFGIFQPALIRNIFNLDQDLQQKKQQVTVFKQILQQNLVKLMQYILPIYKIVLNLTTKYGFEQVIDMLILILSIEGIKNRIVINDAIHKLFISLNTDKVRIRKKIIECLSKLKYLVPFKILEHIEKYLEIYKTLDPNQWYCIFDILSLVQNIIIQIKQCQPPILNNMFLQICFYLDHEVLKIRNKVVNTLAIIILSHKQYREILNEMVTKQVVGVIQDKIEVIEKQYLNKKLIAKIENKNFSQEYQQQRLAYLQYQKNIKN